MLVQGLRGREWQGPARVLRRGAAGLVLIGAVVALAGCEKLQFPWSSPSSANQTGSSATAAVPTTQRSVTPSKPMVLPNDVAATVNGVPISKSDVELRIQELKTLVANVGQTWKPLTAEQLDAVLKELINTELMSQDAIARGLDRTSDTQRRWEFIRRGFFAQEWLRTTRERQEVASSEVEQYYEQNKLGFRQPERRKLRQITVATEDQAKQALSRLLGESADFAALAQQISLAPSAKDGGLLSDWVMRGNEKALLYATEADAKAAGVTSLDSTLEASAFAVDHVGGLSSYVKGVDNRYHIFQLADRQEAKQRPLSEVYDGVKNYLLIQKLQGAIEELTGKAKIERFPERLEGIAQ